MSYTTFLKNTSFYNELWASFQKQQFLQQIMGLLQTSPVVPGWAGQAAPAPAHNINFP